MKKELKIAIIGGGASGIVAAKEAREAGLECEVFEKEDLPGGVWRPNGLAWEKMRVNISRFTGVFSDFSWEQAFSNRKKIPAYPTTLDMHAYLLAYIKHFQLESCIHLGKTVIHIDKDDQGWRITWREKGKIKQQNYAAVILATGRYQVPYIPDFKGLESFSGRWIHSANYRSADCFDDKLVLIVGGSLSGVAIASEIPRVHHLIRRPRWIIPTQVPFGSAKAPIPSDLLDSRESYRARDFNWFMKYCSIQNSIPAWKMTPETPAGTAVSDSYVKKALQGHIQVIKSEIDHFTHSSVVLKNGDVIQPEIIIFCTGYKNDFSFFDKSLIPLLNPLNLYADTFHPNIPNLAWFAINYYDRGAIFPLVELQARFACAIFSGRLTLPSPEQMTAEMLTLTKHNAFTFANLLAEKLGIHHFDEFSQSDPTLYRLLMKGPIVPAQHRVAGPGSKPEMARTQLLAAEKAKQDYLNSNKLLIYGSNSSGEKKDSPVLYQPLISRL